MNPYVIGAILKKPVDPAEFRAAMAFCCDPANHARLLEYNDHYEIAERPAEEPERKAASEDYEPEPDSVETLTARIEMLEKRLWALEKEAR